VRRIATQLALVALLLTLAPVTATAKDRGKLPPAVKAVIEDCEDHDGRLTHHYPAKLLQEALADLPTDIVEYSSCADTIHQAELAEIAAQRHLAVATNTPQAAHKKLSEAEKQGAGTIDLSGEKIAAGTVTVHDGSLLGALPTPLLVVLIALVAIAAIPLTIRVRRIVSARRTS
jgi:hypothetical protein